MVCIEGYNSNSGLSNYCGSQSILGFDMNGIWPILFFSAVTIIQLTILCKIGCHWTDKADKYHKFIVFRLILGCLLYLTAALQIVFNIKFDFLFH